MFKGKGSLPTRGTVITRKEKSEEFVAQQVEKQECRCHDQNPGYNDQGLLIGNQPGLGR